MPIDKTNSLSPQPLVSAVDAQPTPVTQPPSLQQRRKASPAAPPHRLRVEHRPQQADSATTLPQLRSELQQVKLVLAAKRSQHRKMDQWSRMRFVGRLISAAYLDQLASEIAWLGARVTTTQQGIAGMQPAGPAQTQSTPPRLSNSLEHGA